jgi:hypothetical protein
LSGNIFTKATIDDLQRTSLEVHHQRCTQADGSLQNFDKEIGLKRVAF